MSLERSEPIELSPTLGWLELLRIAERHDRRPKIEVSLGERVLTRRRDRGAIELRKATDVRDVPSIASVDDDDLACVPVARHTDKPRLHGARSR